MTAAPQTDEAHELRAIEEAAFRARLAVDDAKRARRSWDYEAHYGRNEPSWIAKSIELDDAVDTASRDLVIAEAEVTKARQETTSAKLGANLVPELLATRHKLATEIDLQMAHIAPLIQAIIEVDQALDAALRSSGIPATFSTGHRYEQNLAVWLVRKLGVGVLRREVGFTQWKTPDKLADMTPAQPSTLPPTEFADLIPADFATDEEEE